MKALASTGSFFCAAIILVVLKACRFIPDNLPYAPFQSAPPGFLPILSASVRGFLSELVIFVTPSRRTGPGTVIIPS